MITKKNLIEKLDSFKKKYVVYEHEAFFTVQDSLGKRDLIKGAHTKNLFLKNKKKEFFLFSCLEHTKVDLKKISKILSLGNISFANEKYMVEYLGVKPGSVSPFGLLNDKENVIKFFLDNNLKNFDKVNFHPLINTATINIGFADFVAFLVENKKKVNIFDFDNYSLIG